MEKVIDEKKLRDSKQDKLNDEMDIVMKILDAAHKEENGWQEDFKEQARAIEEKAKDVVIPIKFRAGTKMTSITEAAKRKAEKIKREAKNGKEEAEKEAMEVIKEAEKKVAEIKKEVKEKTAPIEKKSGKEVMALSDKYENREKELKRIILNVEKHHRSVLEVTNKLYHNAHTPIDSYLKYSKPGESNVMRHFKLQ